MFFFLLGSKTPRHPAIFNHPYRFRPSPFCSSLFLHKCFILLRGKPPRPPILFNHPYRFRLTSVYISEGMHLSNMVHRRKKLLTWCILPIYNVITPKTPFFFGGGCREEWGGEPPRPPCSLNIPIDSRLNLFLFHG